uniref:Uncharacterized protein n=1 Tax=Oryza punctata TaxID=4537 RepID=A0A0E0L6Z9_ORYPU
MESISVNDLAGIICTVAIRSRVSHRSNEAGRARAINWEEREVVAVMDVMRAVRVRSPGQDNPASMLTAGA